VALEEPAVPLMLSGGRFGFDEDRVTTESVAVGEVVDFVLENPTGMGHPFHLYGNEFWATSRSDQPYPRAPSCAGMRQTGSRNSTPNAPTS